MTTSPKPVLFSDEQMREYIANGYVALRPSVPREVHKTIRCKFDSLQEHDGKPGNNILPRLPELELVLQSPEVRGALISVLGPNYISHPHRYWHHLDPMAKRPREGEVPDLVFKNCHQDSYTPAGMPRSHRSRYARIMYYAQDTPMELGPTHVIPGSQYHWGLADEDKQRTLPVTGEAGLVFLSHFDIGHAAGVNLRGQTRHMIKFIFMRADEPLEPTWTCRDQAWKPPRMLTAPYDLEPAWRHLWNWHCGLTNEPAEDHVTLDDSQSRASQWCNDTPVEMKLEVIRQLAQAGSASASVVPELIRLLNEGHQALRTSAIYALASIGKPAVEALLHVLDEAGQRESAHEKPAAWDEATIPMDDAAYALTTRTAVSGLVERLKSPAEWTRINAAFALGEMDSHAASAVPALEALLEDESHRVVRIAITALGTIRKNPPLTALSHLLNADGKDWDTKHGGWTIRNCVNVTAAIALTRLGREAGASEGALVEALRNPLGQVGALAGETLRRIGTDTARHALLDDLMTRRWDDSIRADREF